MKSDIATVIYRRHFDITGDGIEQVKALIFNSGLGSRMGSLTEKVPKSMVALSQSETIFARQVRLLYECGIREMIVTTGAHAQVLHDQIDRLLYQDLRVSFVHNPRFAQTNYIYSFYLAADQVDDDLLILHGDLVFNKELLEAMLLDGRENIAPVNKTLPRPEKDFKARVNGEMISEISVKIEDENCYSFQPLYKLSKEAALKWIGKIKEFVRNDTTSVYAEEALNCLLESKEIMLHCFLSDGMLIHEIDTADDLKAVSKAAEEADRKTQRVYFESDLYGPIKSLIQELGISRPLVVTKTTGERCGLLKMLEQDNIAFVQFDRFQNNPRWDDIEQGFQQFKAQDCDAVISLGGGSAIDVAKCVKTLAEKENGVESSMPIVHIAIPSTAGSGAEATHFAVAYKNNEKISVADEYMRPKFVVLAPSLLETLPLYQKRAAFSDAVCHCIESLWSVKVTDSSRSFALKALKMLMSNMDYFETGADGEETVLLAAHLAGKAIDISETTAAHAMSYKLTNGMNLPHGHAALLCLWAIVEHWDCFSQEEASGEIQRAEELILEGMGAANMTQVSNRLQTMVGKLGMPSELEKARMGIDELTDSVNLQRLQNFPFVLPRETIKKLYAFLLFQEGEQE